MNHSTEDKLWKQYPKCTIMQQAQKAVCDDAALLDSYSATSGANWASSCPACLLIQRPACTLDHWLSNARAEATTPAWTDKASSSPPSSFQRHFCKYNFIFVYISNDF